MVASLHWVVGAWFAIVFTLVSCHVYEFGRWWVLEVEQWSRHLYFVCWPLWAKWNLFHRLRLLLCKLGYFESILRLISELILNLWKIPWVVGWERQILKRVMQFIWGQLLAAHHRLLATWFAHILCCLYSFPHLHILNISNDFWQRHIFFNFLQSWENSFGLLLYLHEHSIVFVGCTVRVAVGVALLLNFLIWIPWYISKFGFLELLARLANELFHWRERSGRRWHVFWYIIRLLNDI